MSIQFPNSINIGGTSSGGANIEGYIPTNTTYTVKTDGTGDFSKLSEAISFLSNKWSTGTVNISIAAGTYSESGTIVIGSSLIGIPRLNITGAGVSNTTIQNTSAGQAILFSQYRNICNLEDLTIENTNSNTPFAVVQCDFANATIKNVKTIKGQYSIFAGGGYSELIMKGTITIQNSSTCAIGVQQQSSVLADQTTLTIDTAPTGVSILRLANFIFAAGSQTWNSVTTQYSQTINTVTKEGCIYHD